MIRLINVGLVRRKSGEYSLTTLGRVVQESQKLIRHAIENYWKLKAIDSIEASDRETFYEERKRIIDALIKRNDIKNILLNRRITDLELAVPGQRIK
jgi:hypothetical protein